MKLTIILLVLFLTACGRGGEDGVRRDMQPLDVVRVTGGSFNGTPYSNLYGTPIVLDDFYIGRFEVTQAEWYEVMGTNPSGHTGEGTENNPVETVNWYDVIVFLNRRSTMTGLTPFYNIDRDTPDPNNYSETDIIRWTVTTNPTANGYRLPTALEWEYAAGGGQLSNGYIFSGSNDATEVAWFFRTSGDEFLPGMWHWPTLEANNGRARNVGQKLPNELGIYDMSGNVREWIYNWHHEDMLTPPSGHGRGVRGGSWVASDDPAMIFFRDEMPPYFATYELGFRVARNA